MKNLKINHEAIHMLTNRAREYLAYMNATLKEGLDGLYLCYLNDQEEWVGDINTANKYLELQNPYCVYEVGNESDEPLKEFDSLDRLKEWCYLQKAASIASGKKPLEYYYNYRYSVEERGDYI